MRADGRGYDAVRVWCAGIAAAGLLALTAPGALAGDDTPAPGAATAGDNAFAMSTEDVAESFSSLSQQQQARVMQRCRDVIARPNQADPNQLALCQTLAALVKR